MRIIQKSRHISCFGLDCRAGMVADLPAVPGGKVSFLNHSRPTKAQSNEIAGRTMRNSGE